jgi:hypothetical protein
VSRPLRLPRRRAFVRHTLCRPPCLQESSRQRGLRLSVCPTRTPLPRCRWGFRRRGTVGRGDRCVGRTAYGREGRSFPLGRYQPGDTGRVTALTSALSRKAQRPESRKPLDQSCEAPGRDCGPVQPCVLLAVERHTVRALLPGAAYICTAGGSASAGPPPYFGPGAPQPPQSESGSWPLRGVSVALLGCS